jgi:hypothetical protein
MKLLLSVSLPHIFTLSLFNADKVPSGNPPTIGTIDSWTNFDTVWCGFSASPGQQTEPNISYGADDVTHFNPPFVIGEIRCCPDAASCGISA